MGREGLAAGHHTESHQMRHIFPTSPHFQLCLKEPLHAQGLISIGKKGPAFHNLEKSTD